jgi:hypothetical protein
VRRDFDRRLKLGFHGSRITSDAGWLACRILDDTPGLSAMAGTMLADTRAGKNGRLHFHALACNIGNFLRTWPRQSPSGTGH